MTPGASSPDRARYERAARLLPWRLEGKVRNAEPRPCWVPGTDCFCYASETEAGLSYVLVDAERGTRRPAFDHALLARLLTRALGRQIDADHIAADHVVVLDAAGQRLDVHVPGRILHCDLARDSFDIEPVAGPLAHELRSPDGRSAMLAREGNLVLRDLASGDERALTTDGSPGHAYAKSPDFNTYAVALQMAGMQQPTIGTWSPDGRYFFTHRLDERHLPLSHLLQTVRPDGDLRPRLYSYRYPLPDEARVAEWEPVIIDIESGRVLRTDLPPVDVNDHTPEEWLRVWWSPDSRRLRFVTSDRSKLRLTLHELDAATGARRVILEQLSETWSMLTAGTPRVGNEGRPNVRFLDASGEFLWYCDTGAKGVLQLHDLATGRCKGVITPPTHLVRDIIHVDEGARRLWFMASGGEPDRDPYYRHLYGVNFDGSDLKRLTPEDAEHNVLVPPPGIESGPRGMSPSGRYFVDTHGRVDRPPQTILRRAADGAEVMVLETADARELEQLGWRWPEPVKAVAADGETALHGVVWRPSWSDGASRLPVILIVYPGPQITLVPKTSFKATPRQSFAYTFCQSLAELGFVVVMVDPRGTPLRERAFRQHSYGNLGGTHQHDDYVAALTQLAAVYPELDLDRVGIHGHSGGGYSTVRAMLTHPGFFKVGVASAGNHDLRGVMSMWVEAFHGPADRHPRVRLDNAEFAANLRGKLLLAYSDMDENVHFGPTYRLIDALIRANRDFDLLVLPNAGHDFAATNRYFLRRLWDYFVRHLQGIEPPADFEFPP